jgi:photosystem II stability/assembly factor-like uncharacterized protein
MKGFSTICAAAFAVLTLCLPSSAQDTTRKTTWEKLPILKPRFKETFYQIAFVNRDVGFMVSNQSIWKTTDGCKTWNAVLQATFLKEKPFSALHFTDAKNGRMVSGGKLYSTDDGGASWAPEDCGNNINTVAAGPDNWIIAGGGQTLYQKRGKGDWEPIKGKGPMPGIAFNDSVQRISIADANTAFVYIWGTDARVIRTTDGGKKWETVYKKGLLDCMYFADPKRGWLTNSAAIHATQDGGDTFKQQLNPEDRRIVTIAFDPAGTFGIAPLSVSGNQNRKLLSTTDGKNWTAVELDLDEGQFVSASVVDGHAYVLMDNGRFIRFDNK